ncbi:MAG: polyprenyl synthetase family protein [Candidatus Omnitrophica bacterium]|nr:polyprenyl synthetase family protein [Candidatus Omnitrophota bacterium]
MKSAATLEDIYFPIERPLKATPGAILDILSTPNELAADVIRYFFSSQGKLLRPALTFLGFAVKQGRPDLENRLLHLAAAFEVFHSATLIHDDIIDSAYIRRSIPTINVKWGAQTAVLVGDYLHDKAIGAVFQNGNEKIVSLFLQTAGTVCDGEIHELKEKDNFNLTENEYLDIVDKKTAALLGCCVEAGAMLAGATPEEAEALKRYGKYFGIAFQIVDDCLDFTGNQQEFGKTLGADCAAGVLTLPLIRLTQLVDEKKKSDVFKIFKSEMGTNKFQTLLSMILEYDTIDYSFEKARQFIEKAKLELLIFPDSPARKSLIQMADYVLERNK